MNLFLGTRRLTAAGEDHLTEFMCAALRVDSRFQEEYGRIVLREFARENGWPDPVIKSTSTQVVSPEARSQPDLLLELASGHHVICEHKLEASETELADKEDQAAPGQLGRYLTLNVDGVAYFRSDWAPPGEEVLRHPRYIKPSHREHFLWEDLYEALRDGTHEICQWLREGFEELGLTPPHGLLGELRGDSDQVVENQKNFAKLWSRTRSWCRDLGWKVGTGSRCELYLRDGPASVVDEIYITPLRNRGRTLLIRLVPKRLENLEGFLARVRVATGAARVSPEVKIRRTRPGGNRPVVDVSVPLFELLPEEGDPDAMQQLLLEFTAPVIQEASVKPMERGSEGDLLSDEGPNGP